MSQELKPCPFCGSDKLNIVSRDTKTRWVMCMQCSAEGPGEDSVNESIESWNRRHEAQQPAQAPKCQTCNGQGLIGGHMQDGSGYGEPCPDCNSEQPAQAAADARDAERYRALKARHSYLIVCRLIGESGYSSHKASEIIDAYADSAVSDVRAHDSMTPEQRQQELQDEFDAALATHQQRQDGGEGK